MNARLKSEHADWRKELISIRKAELAELKELAEGSEALRHFVSGLEEIQRSEIEDGGEEV